ncbi:MAG: hypothetical protein GY898_34060 [Proteobacteria bacterium]|nr:hypothetical protein [Pseudomonadota bacterium]
MTSKRLLPILLLAVVATGCSTAHHARPLGKGNQAIHASIGGPIAGIGSDRTPIPLTTLTYKVGVTDRTDVFVGWHVLETFVNGGNAYFDIGASYYLLDQKKARPGLSAAFTVSPLINKKSGWASFDLQITASWTFDPLERTLLYVGFHNYFVPVRRTIDDRPTPVYTFSPYLGGQVRVGKKRRLGLALEVKWHRPYASTKDAVVGYVGPGNLGALGFLTGITVFIGKDTKPKLKEVEE